MFIHDSKPKELMSEDLQGVLQEENIVNTFQESFISVIIVTQDKEDSLIGSLVGVQLESNIKLDMRVSLEDAYSFVSKILTNKISKLLSNIIFSYSDNSTVVKGPFEASSIKIVEIESNSKVCVLAIDLIRQQGNSQ